MGGGAGHTRGAAGMTLGPVCNMRLCFRPSAGQASALRELRPSATQQARTLGLLSTHRVQVGTCSM